MARDLTAGMVTALGAQTIHPIFLIKAEFPSGDLNIWTGVGNITYNSETYTGAGHLLQLAPAVETQKLEASGARFILSGAIQSLIELAEAEEYQNRLIHLYFALINDDRTLVSDPYEIFTGRMDVMSIEDSGDQIIIEMTAENKMIDLERARKRYYTKEDQNLDFPNDTFFDQVTALQDKEITWGPQ